MAQRIGLLAGTNDNWDTDLSAHIDSILNEGVIDGLVVSDTQVTAGRAFVKVKRDGTPDKYFYVLYETEDIVTIAPTNNQYIYIEVNQAKINDGSTNPEAGTGIGEIKVGASVPSDNCIILAKKDGGGNIVTTERQIISLKGITQKGKGNWKVYYTDGNGVEQEVALGSAAQVLTSNGPATAPSFNTPTVDIHGLTEKISINPNDELILSDSEASNVNKKIKYGTLRNGLFNFELGENISVTGGVALMGDGKIYKINNNKRQLSSFSGTVNDRFCTLPNNKVARITISGATLTIYIGEINLGTNAISRGSGVQVTTNYSNNLTMCSAGVDKLFIGYSNSGDKTAYGRGVSISGLVPSVGSQVSLVTGFYFAAQQSSCYVAEGKFAVAVYESNNGPIKLYSTVGSISGNTVTYGGSTGVLTLTNDSPNYEVKYVTDNIYSYTFRNNISNLAYIELVSVSGTTPTAGSAVSLGNNTLVKVVSDGVGVYVLVGGTTVNKYTYSGNTLSSSFSASVDSSTLICKSGGLIGVISGTTIIWYSQNGTLTKRNTIDYSIGLGNIFENPYGLGYITILSPGTTGYIHKIGNEERNVIGYLAKTGNLGDSKFIYINGGVVTGLSNIIPGENYYISSTGTLLLSGTYKFARGLTSSIININIDVI